MGYSSGVRNNTKRFALAGLEEITSGTLEIDGKNVNDVEPKDRDIAMVFQNYSGEIIGLTWSDVNMKKTKLSSWLKRKCSN